MKTCVTFPYAYVHFHTRRLEWLFANICVMVYNQESNRIKLLGNHNYCLYCPGNAHIISQRNITFPLIVIYIIHGIKLRQIPWVFFLKCTPHCTFCCNKWLLTDSVSDWCCLQPTWILHSRDMNVMASQITGNATICRSSCSEVYQIKYQSSALQALCVWNPKLPPHKGPVMWNRLPSHDVIIDHRLEHNI